MSTFLHFHIKGSNTEALVSIIKTFSDFSLTEQTHFPDDISDNYLTSEDDDPTYLVIGESKDGWTTVYHNSFKKLNHWGQEISKTLGTTFIQIIGQTTSDAYYFSLFEKGDLLREIEVLSSEGEILIDNGEKFSFEKPVLLTDDFEDPDNFFDMDTLEMYCKNFGLDILGMFEEPQPGNYLVLKRNKSEVKKSWWKF